MKRSGAVPRFTLIFLAVLLVGAGGVGLYYYTTPTGGSNYQSAQPATRVSSSGGGAGNASTTTGALDTSKYLGYLPPGYVAAPRYANSIVFPCPAGMSPSACKIFQSTCGNGVCDPNERCDTCPIDCGVTGQLVCDPYTGRAGAPTSVCQAILDKGAFG